MVSVASVYCVCLFHIGSFFSLFSFALIYDSVEDALDFEPNYRLARAGLKGKPEKPSRKLRRELKNRKLKARATAKTKVGGK